MRLKTRQTHEARQRWRRLGRGGFPRLHLVLFIATAFLLVPVAQAAAEGELTAVLAGTGTGEVYSDTEGEGAGTPKLECSNIVGEEKSVCTNAMAKDPEENFREDLHAVAGPGSEFTGWTVEEGLSAEFGSLCFTGKKAPDCQLIALGGSNGKIKATFKAKPVNFVKVEGAGAGSGTVTSTGGETNLNCTITEGVAEGECEAEILKFASFETTATPAGGSEFTAWGYSGGGISECEENSPENPCTTFFTSTGEKGTLTATFEAEPLNVFNIAAAGTGSGTVVSTAEFPGNYVHVSCHITEGVLDAPCAGEVGKLTLSPIENKVVVTVTPDAGSEYVECTHTGGGLTICDEFPEENPFELAFFGSGEEGTWTVTLEAEPIPTFALNLSTSGTGTGSLKCDTGSGAKACAAEYNEGTEVEVIATAASGSEFVGFSGDCAGTSCSVTMNEEHTVGAQFDDIPDYALSLSTSGTGTGSLKCDTGSGPGACAAEYEAGTEVTVIATAGVGSEFVGFSGDCTGSSCELTMGAAKSVDAQFDLVSVSLSVTQEGEGSVECEVNAGGLGACPSSATYGDAIKVVAVAAPENNLVGLTGTGSASGECDKETGLCEFTITAASSVNAKFASASKVDSAEGNVHGEVPQTTSLESACEDVDLGEFIPGVEADYSNTCGLVLTSTGAESTLTAEDESATHTGHLVQGSYFLPSPLETAATDSEAKGTGPGLTSLESPVTLLTFAEPIAKDAATVEFNQHIGENDGLHTGVYAKTITLTLEQTTP